MIHDPGPKSPRVAVIVVNYNGLKWLPDCLSSLAKTEYPNINVYFVDNSSTDRSADYVFKNFQWVKIIRNLTNLGFAGGCNSAARNVECDYLLFMNADTQVLNPRWITFLVGVAGADSKIAAVNAKLVSMEDRSLLDSVGGMGIPFWRGFVDIGRKELDQGEYDSRRFEPFSFCGASALIRKDLFMKVGGFDEKLFLFNEDVDLSWRLRLLGYRIGFAPEAKVAHYFSGSVGSRSVDARVLFYCHKNLLRAILKNCGSSLPWALRNFFLFSLIVIAGFFIFDPKRALAFMKAILWNLLNFRDTYAKRLTIQGGRITSEREILTRMYPPIRRYQPAEHVTLRRILNILFQHSQQYRLHQPKARG